jgi:hypothetical protein
LLCGPLGCRIRGHIEMNDLPATVKEDNEAEVISKVEKTADLGVKSGIPS